MKYSLKKKVYLLVALIPLSLIFNIQTNGEVWRLLQIATKDLLLLPDPVISDTILIEEKWQTVAPQKPLTSLDLSHEVAIYSKSFEYLSLEEEDNNQLFEQSVVIYKDGRKGKMEVILIDDLGTEYPLSVCTQGEFVISFTRNLTDEEKYLRRQKGEPLFPYERTYTALKIRSDLPITIEKILWETYGHIPLLPSPLNFFKSPAPIPSEN
jgi:hypothetical protein